MDLTDFKIFKDFYILRNLTDVSRLNYITQPSVSYRLSKMQEELSTKLYDYNGEYQFTENGKSFYTFCERMVKDYESIQSSFKSRKSIEINLSSVAVYLYLDNIYSVLKNHHIFPVIQFTHSDIAVRSVVDGRSFFSIIGGVNLELPKFVEKIAIGKENIKLIYHCSLDDNLKNIPIVLDERNSGLYKLVDNYLKKYSNINIAGEVGIAYEKIGLVNNNRIGIFISEGYLEKFFQDYKNIKVSKNYGFEREIFMIFYKKNKNNAIIQETIEKLKE